ncbi:hypothetical protein ACJBSU_10370 [Streptococcus suis]
MDLTNSVSDLMTYHIKTGITKFLQTSNHIL